MFKPLQNKERLSLYDLSLVEKSLQCAKVSKKNSDIKRHLKKTIRLLTGRRVVFFFQLEQLERLLKDAGYEQATEPVEFGNKQLLKTTSWLGARINKTPHEVATSMVKEELDYFIREVTRKILRESLALMRAYHSPTTYADEVFDELRELAETEEDEHKIINQKVKPISLINVMREAIMAK